MKYMIFDLDGTLLDTLDDLAASVNFALAQNGMPTRTTEEVRRFIGNGIRKLIERAVLKDCPPDAYERTFACFKVHYAENCSNATKPYDGMPQLLGELRRSGIGLAVVSNKADALSKRLIDRFYPDTFEAVWGEREGVPKKPAPDPLLLCCREIGAATDCVTYVGDTEVDLATARAAGCRCALVTWGFRSAEEVAALSPDLIAHTPSDLF